MKRDESVHPNGGKLLGDVALAEVSRRNFVKSAATVAALAAAVPFEPLLSGKASVAEAASVNSNSANRMNDCFNYRKNMALSQRVNGGPQSGNGDATQFADFSGCYSKALMHDHLGVPNSAALLSLRNALATGNPADFANIIVGTPGGDGNSKLN